MSDGGRAAAGVHAPASKGARYWRRNLAVSTFGSFTTIVAMTLLLPFLPLYIEQLGESDPAAIVQWSGIAYGATFFAAASVAPLWGRLGAACRSSTRIRHSIGATIRFLPLRRSGQRRGCSALTSRPASRAKE
jgi:MFS family permease